MSASIDYHSLAFEQLSHDRREGAAAESAVSVITRPVSRIHPDAVREGGLTVDIIPAPVEAPAPEDRRSESREPDRSARVAALLAEMIDCQDPVRRSRLQSAVVVEHMGVARSIASRYRGRGVERGDLEQLACLGLVKAVSRWLPGLSDDFLQFAVPTISGEIKRYFRDHSWLVRPPRRIQELRAAINVAERDFQDSGELRPTDGLVGQRLGVREEDIREARAAAGLCRPPSLDSDSGAGLFIAQQWSGEDSTTAVDDRMSLDVVLSKLTERERRVVGMRFSEGLSQARIGEVIGVSQMQVSRILRDVLNKLRDGWEQ
ncbi:sigma-70 family RNA polymerase sigma factor [Nakamurella sp. PAMC28650]|uniref:sigma-70 family RNA polymerase sigma factor n=1 Tax=Nakamurella sp. PAMC28650 TaxID=2762325 RepID=UPI00164E7BB9|nr:sigma-70 family RNA polymerase sigma factor [Nakamurella sp. PAMC28650]QNK81334.1 sigma-70 family RNA polymerase sigma factor [Nakamurella sp. PAMC28650]